MTRAKDISKIVTDADLSGTLDVTGAVTAGGLTVEDSSDATIQIKSTKNGTWTIGESLGSLDFFGSDTSGSGTGVKSSIQSNAGVANGAGFGLDIFTHNTASLNKRISIDYNGDISFYEDTGTTPKLFWDASTESLGIGKTDITTTSAFTVQNTDNSTQILMGLYNANGNRNFAFRPATDGNPNLLMEKNDGTDTILLDTDGNSYFNGGNVGIGTSSPSLSTASASASGLEINGTVPAINLKESGGDEFLLYGGGSSATIYTVNNLRFLMSGSEKMRLTTDGNLLVGTTVQGNAGGISLLPNNSSGAGTIVFDRTSTTSSSTALAFENGNSGVGSIAYSNLGTSFNTSSDHRLKENVTADWDATTRLKQLNPVRFNFISDADTTVDGFLAHEVQSVVPEAITGTHNEVDADGNPVYQGIDQSKLVPLLVKTIQELEARITALENGE